MTTEPVTIRIVVLSVRLRAVRDNVLHVIVSGIYVPAFQPCMPVVLLACAAHAVHDVVGTMT